MTPVPLERVDVAAQSAADHKTIFENYEAITAPLTLSDAMARALRYNLDRRAKLMEEALSLGQLDVDRFDLLPKITAGIGYAGRSDHSTSKSRDAVTLEPALSDPYYSTDRDRILGDLTVSWNILDFGVSWYSARQNADRALIATERRRKTVDNLMLETRFSYWRAAAAQQLEPAVKSNIEAAEKALANAATVAQEQLHNPVDALRYQKTLLETLRQLEALQQDLSTARSQLNALINVPPGAVIPIAKYTAQEMVPPAWNMSIDEMEQTALSNNPDLREQIYQSRIAAAETKKTILRLLPGISFTSGRQYDSNSFLIDNYWNEASARLTFNLFNVIAAPSQIRLAHTTEEVVTAKRLALHMAVLAQVHVAWNQYLGAVRQYDRADQLYTIEARLAQITATRQQADAQSVLDRISNQTSAITAELRRYDTFAQAQAAVARIEGTLGVDPLPEHDTGGNIASLSAIIAQRMELLDRGELSLPQASQTSQRAPLPRPKNYNSPS